MTIKNMDPPNEEKTQMNIECISKLFDIAQDEIEVDKELQSLLRPKGSSTQLKRILKDGANMDAILSQFGEESHKSRNALSISQMLRKTCNFLKNSKTKGIVSDENNKLPGSHMLSGHQNSWCLNDKITESELEKELEQYLDEHSDEVNMTSSLFLSHQFFYI
ncbi:hypothetical protein PGTUg99_026218 [Puccinia graminis f. sp. tritici]|uniref:Uncharacterized protein n=1 Tax=Puccinia graminis f. sp. tritici TaxID=56615 RepID=A0A5B0R680_PUCGR|nr:hypothetical protein PGTUg99_026218 [Puccinia graminis f. sp. tritici]